MGSEIACKTFVDLHSASFMFWQNREVTRKPVKLSSLSFRAYLEAVITNTQIHLVNKEEISSTNLSENSSSTI